MNKKYMLEAIRQAEKAKETSNVPVGCVIVYNGKIIAKGYNKKNSLKSAIMHAEIEAIDKACKKLGTWILDECDLYVTLEPCYMCKGAILESRIKNVYYILPSTYYDCIDNSLKKVDFIKIEEFEEYKREFSLFFKNMR